MSINLILFYLNILFKIIFLLVLIVLRKRIKIVIKLFAEAQKAFIDMPLLLMIPVFKFIVLVIFYSYWILVAIILASNNSYIQKNEILKKTMWFYHIFGLLWVSEFIFACEAILVSGAVSKWYFTR
jgi:solute carrier family 44 protein 1 (choline transporter-like protein)